jgi:hypothetical protein
MPRNRELQRPSELSMTLAMDASLAQWGGRVPRPARLHRAGVFAAIGSTAAMAAIVAAKTERTLLRRAAKKYSISSFPLRRMLSWGGSVASANLTNPDGRKK